MNVFKIFKAEGEKQLDKRIKVVRLDKGGECYMKDTMNRAATEINLQDFLNKKALLPDTQCLERLSSIVLVREEI